MQLINLPPEIILRVLSFLGNIQDKLELFKSCRYFKQFLSNANCWQQLDFTPFHKTITNQYLLQFLKSTHINNTMVINLDLSGCFHLSEDLITSLLKSLTNLKELYLNGFHHNASHQFELNRNFVYQIRPSHDLSSMSMDLSKKSSNQLKVPVMILLKHFSQLSTLSIQYQDLTTVASHQFNVACLTHLDISSCSIQPSVLQSLLRNTRNLIQLKMLNIDLTNLTLLTLLQYCKKLELLHLSCNELRHLGFVISNLKNLTDFRLTHIRTGSIDPIVVKLPLGLKRLDISPKMNIYFRNKHPSQKPNYTKIEHDLLLTDISIHHLSNCTQLVELRLCFPTITESALNRLFKALPLLEIFELRQKTLVKDENHLSGLRYATGLKELNLFNVYLSTNTISHLVLAPIRYMILSNTGSALEENIQQLLCMPSLKSLRLGHLLKPIQAPVKDKHNVVISKKFNDWYFE